MVWRVWRDYVYFEPQLPGDQFALSNRLLQIPLYIRFALQCDPPSVLLYQKIRRVNTFAVVLLVFDAGHLESPGHAALELYRLRLPLQKLLERGGRG